jgi:NhaP-type Na+/H+ or K+/H+ antiporter
VVSLPRDISPGAAARRSLLADLLIAIALALLAFQFAAGIGVVGFLALLAAVALLLWIGIEAALKRKGG